MSLTARLSARMPASAPPPCYAGRVHHFDGHIIECDGFPATIGTLCTIETQASAPIMAEIIGFHNSHNVLCVHAPAARIRVGARVTIYDTGDNIAVGTDMLGRVFDSLGGHLDDRPPPKLADTWPLAGIKLNPLARQAIDTPLDVGVRVINSLLTVGRGQRLGIIAGSGVGKSILLGMMARFTAADIIVVALIGERGREVGEFVKRIFCDEARTRIVVIAEPADRSPLLRIRAANRATAIAEYFRHKNKHVLLIMDSLTRVAHARREIGLALGEQPTAKGYPPSVISMLPALIERSGNAYEGQGSITSFYTILADGDDVHDPVVDTARAILDGHIVLSRVHAQMGIYPAIDIAASVSRVMHDLASTAQREAASLFRRLSALYLENRDLILMGGYSQGQDADLDLAIKLWPHLTAHIHQPFDTKAVFDEAVTALLALFQKG